MTFVALNCFNSVKYVRFANRLDLYSGRLRQADGRTLLMRLITMITYKRTRVDRRYVARVSSKCAAVIRRARESNAF